MVVELVNGKRQRIFIEGYELDEQKTIQQLLESLAKLGIINLIIKEPSNEHK